MEGGGWAAESLPSVPKCFSCRSGGSEPLIALEIPTPGEERSHGHPRGDKEASSVIPRSGRILLLGRVPLVTASLCQGMGMALQTGGSGLCWILLGL